MKTEHFYTCKGTQRRVNVKRYGETITYNLTAPEGSFVEYTDMPEEIVAAGKATWFRLLDNSGALSNATAIRVYSNGFDLACLTVETSADPAMGCAGEMARMNAVLAAVNSDMRVCAAMV